MSKVVLAQNVVVGGLYMTQKKRVIKVLSIDKTNKIVNAAATDTGELVPVPFSYDLLEQSVPSANPSPANVGDNVPGVAAKPGHDSTPPVANASSDVPGVVAGAGAPVVTGPSPASVPTATPPPAPKKAKSSKPKKAPVQDEFSSEIKKRLDEVKALKAQRKEKAKEQRAIMKSGSTGVPSIDRDIEFSKKVANGVPYTVFVHTLGKKAIRVISKAFMFMNEGKCKVVVTNDGMISVVNTRKK